MNMCGRAFWRSHRCALLGLASFIKSPQDSLASMPSIRFVSAAKRGFCSYNPFAPKSLNSILKADRLRNATPEEIRNIWNEHHVGRGQIRTIMKKEQYCVLEHRANTCSMFVLPLRQANGYVSMFLQARMPYMLFTGLEDYKANGPKASSYFTVTYYNELADSKGLILVHGSIIFTSKLSDAEAKSLLTTAHSFYLTDSRHRLVQQFNKESREFEFNDVLRELGLPLG